MLKSMETAAEEEETFCGATAVRTAGTARSRFRSMALPKVTQELPGVILKHGAAGGDARKCWSCRRKGHDDAAGDAEKAAINAREPSPAKIHDFISWM